MSTFKILSVEIVEGKTLKPNWHNPMQKIKTAEGEFIDNMPGKQFGYHRDAEPGFDWEQKINQTVQAKIINCDGLNWLNSMEDKVSQKQTAKPKDNLVKTSELGKRHGVNSKFEKRLIDLGYLEIQQDGTKCLTSKGKDAGGEPRVSKQHGPYFMWPETLKIDVEP